MKRIKLKLNENFSKTVLTLTALIIIFIAAQVSAINFTIETNSNSSDKFQEDKPIKLISKLNFIENERFDLKNLTIKIENQNTKNISECTIDSNAQKILCNKQFISINQTLNNISITGYGFEAGENGKINLNLLWKPETILENTTYNISIKAYNFEGTKIEQTNIFSFQVENKIYKEDFETMSIPASYTTANLTGNNNISWHIETTRTSSSYTINNQTPILRGKDYNSHIKAENLQGGINFIEFNYKKAFTGSGLRQAEVLINNISIGTTESFDDTNLRHFKIDNLNITQNFTIEIRNIKNKQIAIDNIMWG